MSCILLVVYSLLLVLSVILIASIQNIIIDISSKAEEKIFLCMLIFIFIGFVVSVCNYGKTKQQEPKIIYEKVEMSEEERMVLLQGCVEIAHGNANNPTTAERMEILGCGKIL